MKPELPAVWQLRHCLRRSSTDQFLAAADWPKAPVRADDSPESDRLWRRSPADLLLEPLPTELCSAPRRVPTRLRHRKPESARAFPLTAESHARLRRHQPSNIASPAAP